MTQLGFKKFCSPRVWKRTEFNTDKENEAEQQLESLDLTEINNVSSGGHLFHSSVYCLQFIITEAYLKHL